MKTALKTVTQKRPGPSPAVFAKVMSRIHQEIQTAPKEIPPANETSRWDPIERVFRSLFEIRWVPALASFLIIGQAVFLLSVLGRHDGRVGPGPHPGPIIDRGISQGTPAIPIIMIQVEFVETAKEIQIRNLVRELDGQIVNGPTREGLYILEFPQTEMSSSPTLLATLQSHPELIKTATSLNP